MTGPAREGAPFTIRVTRDGGLDETAFAPVDVLDSALDHARSAVVEFVPKDSEFATGEVSDGRSGFLTLIPPPDGKLDPDGERVMTIRLHDTGGSRRGADRAVWYEAAGTLELNVTVEDTGLSVDGPALAVGPAGVREPESGTVPLQFRVCLWTARDQCPDAGKNEAFEAYAGLSHLVIVDYATRDGSARAGEDYRATSGTLIFEPGETVKTVEVPVLADAHDEGIETVWLELSNPEGAAIGRYRNFGFIRNTGPVPNAWIARFGRTVGEQVIEAVEGRMRSGASPGAEVTLAGQALEVATDEEWEAFERREAEARLAALSEWLRGESGVRGAQSRAVRGREILTGSSFALTAGSAETGFGAVWGRSAVSHFGGREGDLSLDGEVTTGMLGADWRRGRWSAGLIVSQSASEGGYSGAPPGTEDTLAGLSGRVEATMTGVFPWARLAPTPRLEAWGALGYGAGELTVTPTRPGRDGDGAALRAKLDLAMAAAGLRGTLLDGGGESLTLTGKTDAFALETSSGRGRGADSGNLAPARATVTRLRLGLEASRPVHLDASAVLTPSFEAGVRHDGGDAESGFGLDLGAGLTLRDPETGLGAELRGRGLLSHESTGLRERGFSGALSWRQRPRSDRGATFALTQTVGGASSGGADALLSARDAGRAGGEGWVGQRTEGTSACAEARIRHRRPRGSLHLDAGGGVRRRGHRTRLRARLAAHAAGVGQRYRGAGTRLRGAAARERR